MGIGFSIFLIAFGAIIAFGVDFQLSWLNLTVVGWVMILAGFSGLILTLYFWSRRRRTTNVVDERHYYDGRAAPDSQRVHPTEPLPDRQADAQPTRREYQERPAPPPG
ncbi:MAG TPA: DUF6458 family protein [Micromonosporaceae bacterium]